MFLKLTSSSSKILQKFFSNFTPTSIILTRFQMLIRLAFGKAKYKTSIYFMFTLVYLPSEFGSTKVILKSVSQSIMKFSSYRLSHVVAKVFDVWYAIVYSMQLLPDSSIMNCI